MRNRSRNQGVFALIACAALVVASATTIYQGRPSMETAVHGRFTKGQIVARSEPLFQSLLAEATQIETSAYSNTTYTGSGRSVHQWSVDCTDVKSGGIAHLFWDADTGDLIRASRSNRRDRTGGFNEPTNRKQAVNLAWDWFHAMKIDRPAENWRLLGGRKKPFAQWDMYFRCGGHCTVVTVCTCSGQLIQVVCAQLPDANTTWPSFKRDAAS